MSKLRTLSTIIALLVSTTVFAEDVPFSESDFAPFAGNGPATLEGEAFLGTKGGGVKTCAGGAVFLAPNTKYDIDVITSLTFSRDAAMRKAGPAGKYWKESVCDSQGKFSIEDVPLGEWIVLTDVSWFAENNQKQGGLVAKKVTIRDKKNKVILNQATHRVSALFGGGWLR